MMPEALRVKAANYIWISEGKCVCVDGGPNWRYIGKVRLKGDSGAILALNICTKCHHLMVDDGLSGMVALNPALLEPAKPGPEKKEGL